MEGTPHRGALCFLYPRVVVIKTGKTTKAILLLLSFLLGSCFISYND